LTLAVDPLKSGISCRHISRLAGSSNQTRRSCILAHPMTSVDSHISPTKLPFDVLVHSADPSHPIASHPIASFSSSLSSVSSASHCPLPGCPWCTGTPMPTNCAHYSLYLVILYFLIVSRSFFASTLFVKWSRTFTWFRIWGLGFRV
jgi:hypothetical protein